MRLDCIYFHSAPYTSPEAQQKVETLAAILARFGMGTHLHVVSFTAVQMRIKEKAPLPWATVLLRVCMVKAAALVAAQTGASALVTGESLGQVASQTLENMRVSEAAAALPLLRPLVGTDKEDIVATARRIGTYDTSILPYPDCCVLFSPPHPVLHANPAEAAEHLANLAIDDVVAEAVGGREVKRFACSGAAMA
jgi:thiamine biosynthesis protein ThiI